MMNAADLTQILSKYLDANAFMQEHKAQLSLADKKPGFDMSSLAAAVDASLEPNESVTMVIACSMSRGKVGQWRDGLAVATSTAKLIFASRALPSSTDWDAFHIPGSEITSAKFDGALVRVATARNIDFSFLSQDKQGLRKFGQCIARG